MPPPTPTSANGVPKPRQEFAARTHAASGYSWSREEDAPGYGWLNKKALDEGARAWEGMVHRELMVRGRYGDIFEMVSNEGAVIESLTQR